MLTSFEKDGLNQARANCKKKKKNAHTIIFYGLISSL